MDGRGRELQQITSGQHLRWRALDAQTPKAAAAFSGSEPSPDTPKFFRARPSLALQIPRGERRFRGPRYVSRRAARRWIVPALTVSALALMTGAVAIAVPLERLKTVDFAGNFRTSANALMIAAGFGINQVSVTGQHYAADSDIFDALDLPNVKTFAAFDSEAALKRIDRIPWVDKAQITRVYPSSLDIVIRERVPAVMWTRDNVSYLVDASGRVLGPVPAANTWVLPRVVGEGAAREAPALLAALRQKPAIDRQFAYGERIAERRWRVVLKNGTEIELAADREIEGLEEVANSRAVAGALTGAAMIVDLRTPGAFAERPVNGTEAKKGARAAPLAAGRA
jgi:cell division protein FtsQ